MNLSWTPEKTHTHTHTEKVDGVLLIVSKAVLVKFLGDGVKRMWAFPKTQIPSYCKMHTVADIIWLFCIKYEVGGWLLKLFTWMRVCFDLSFSFFFCQILPTDRQVMCRWSRKDAKAGQQDQNISSCSASHSCSTRHSLTCAWQLPLSFTHSYLSFGDRVWIFKVTSVCPMMGYWRCRNHNPLCRKSRAIKDSLFLRLG